MRIQNLVLLTSLVAIGCGEKSDEESDESRLEELAEACHGLNDSYMYYAAECSFPAIDFECDDKIDRTREEDCIDEAEAALECSERIGYTDLECDEGDAALTLCAAEGLAWNACVGL